MPSVGGGYARIRIRKPDVPQKLAVRWAVRRAVSAVRGGAKFARTTPRNRDAYGQARADMPADVVARPYNGDPDDRRPVDARIALLPERLRTTAEYLSYGLPKTTVAALLRTSTSVVYERVAEIAKIFAAVEPAAVETAPEPSDDEAPLPRGLRSYQPRLIPVSAEHEHIVRPLHTRWRLRGWKSWKKSTGMEAGVRYVHPGEIRVATAAAVEPPVETAPVREFRPIPYVKGREPFIGTVTSTPDTATLVALLVTMTLARR